MLWASHNESRLISKQKKALELAVKRIEELGGKVEYPIDIRHPSTFGDDMRTVIGNLRIMTPKLSFIILTSIVHESTRAIPDWLQTLEGGPKTAEELVKFNEENAELELPEGNPLTI